MKISKAISLLAAVVKSSPKFAHAQLRATGLDPSKDHSPKRALTDACDPNPCQNRGTCVSRDGISYFCLCASGWVGDNCDVVDPCYPDNPCQNGGNCGPLPGDTSTYDCDCCFGYRGRNCEIDRCALVACQCDGTCVAGGLGQYSCDYPPGSFCRLRANDECTPCTTSDDEAGCVYHQELKNGDCTLQCVGCESTCDINAINDSAVQSNGMVKTLGCPADEDVFNTCKNKNAYEQYCDYQ